MHTNRVTVIATIGLLAACGARPNLASSSNGFDLGGQGPGSSDAATEANGDAASDDGATEDVVEPTWDGGAKLCPLTPPTPYTACPYGQPERSR